MRMFAVLSYACHIVRQRFGVSMCVYVGLYK